MISVDEEKGLLIDIIKYERQQLIVAEIKAFQEPMEKLLSDELHAILTQTLNSFKERDRQIIALRFGQELSVTYGVTDERIRQIVVRMLNSLKMKFLTSEQQFIDLIS